MDLESRVVSSDAGYIISFLLDPEILSTYYVLGTVLNYGNTKKRGEKFLPPKRSKSDVDSTKYLGCT